MPLPLSVFACPCESLGLEGHDSKAKGVDQDGVLARNESSLGPEGQNM